MDNKEFSRLLENRTKKFAISVIRLSTSLPNSPEGKAKESVYKIRNEYWS